MPKSREAAGEQEFLTNVKFGQESVQCVCARARVGVHLCAGVHKKARVWACVLEWQRVRVWVSVCVRV